MFGVICDGIGQFFNVTDADIDSTGWSFRGDNATWDTQARAAFALCNRRGFEGGSFTGNINGDIHALSCYPGTIINAHDADLDATGWGFRGDNTGWGQAGRAAYGFCVARGYRSGQMNGNIFGDLHGVVCSK
jgi:hypothetical protein